MVSDKCCALDVRSGLRSLTILPTSKVPEDLDRSSLFPSSWTSGAVCEKEGFFGEARVFVGRKPWRRVGESASVTRSYRRRYVRCRNRVVAQAEVHVQVQLRGTHHANVAAVIISTRLPEIYPTAALLPALPVSIFSEHTLYAWTTTVTDGFYTFMVRVLLIASTWQGNVTSAVTQGATISRSSRAPCASFGDDCTLNITALLGILGCVPYLPPRNISPTSVYGLHRRLKGCPSLVVLGWTTWPQR